MNAYISHKCGITPSLTDDIHNALHVLTHGDGYLWPVCLSLCSRVTMALTEVRLNCENGRRGCPFWVSKEGTVRFCELKMLKLGPWFRNNRDFIFCR